VIALYRNINTSGSNVEHLHPEATFEYRQRRSASSPSSAVRQSRSLSSIPMDFQIWWKYVVEDSFPQVRLGKNSWRRRCG
jgi:hypothetical protein